MRWFCVSLTLAASFAVCSALATEASDHSVQLGPRPFYLIEKLSDNSLKDALKQCAKSPFVRSDFSIAHRGAPLQFPEHTKEAYEAGARMGAGIVECDVTFTSDAELVCRHSQCDLHTTTNIVARDDLRNKCQVPPAFDGDGNLTNAADIKCCTSDITLAEFKSLCGKMDASNKNATTVEEYLSGTPNWRTDLYATFPPNPDNVCTGTVVSHTESIDLLDELGVKFTPELKSPSVQMPFDTDGDGVGDFSQEAYAQKLIDEYKKAGIPSEDVWAQSFNLDDVLYWISNEPAFGAQAVFLDDIDPADSNADNDQPPTLAELESLKAEGVRIIAPPMWALVRLDEAENIVPSQYALDAKKAELDIIAWSFERSAPVQSMKDGSESNWYYQTTLDALITDGDILKVLDVLAMDVGIIGLFSDWPATVTYYASCMDL